MLSSSSETASNILVTRTTAYNERSFQIQLKFNFWQCSDRGIQKLSVVDSQLQGQRLQSLLGKKYASTSPLHYHSQGNLGVAFNNLILSIEGPITSH